MTEQELRDKIIKLMRSCVIENEMTGRKYIDHNEIPSIANQILSILPKMDIVFPSDSEIKKEAKRIPVTGFT